MNNTSLKKKILREFFVDHESQIGNHYTYDMILFVNLKLLPNTTFLFLRLNPIYQIRIPFMRLLTRHTYHPTFKDQRIVQLFLPIEQNFQTFDLLFHERFPRVLPLTNHPAYDHHIGDV